MLARLCTGLFLLAVMLLLLWQGRLWVWQVATFLAVLPAAWEWAILGGLNNKAAMWYTGLFALLLVLGGVLLDGNLTAADAVLTVVCGWWALVAPWSLRHQWRRRLWFLALGMLLLFAAWHAAAILFIGNVYVLAAVLAVVWTSDSAAYFFGKAMGRHRMAPQISPGKTWEGFFGGLGAVLLLAYLAGPLVFSAPPSVWLVAAAAAVVGLGVLGDLFESSLKRQAGMKDSSALLGSHGGMLDRIDALLPALPFAALLAPWLG